jgi:hypothetical protein
VDRGRPLRRGFEPGEVHLGELARADRAEPLEEHLRPGECLLNRNLLVEREADEQRHRVAHEEPIGLVVSGEVQSVRALGDRHAVMVSPAAPRATMRVRPVRMSRSQEARCAR